MKTGELVVMGVLGLLVASLVFFILRVGDAGAGS
jgi:hypothetical protein